MQEDQTKPQDQTQPAKDEDSESHDIPMEEDKKPAEGVSEAAVAEKPAEQKPEEPQAAESSPEVPAEKPVEETSAPAAAPDVPAVNENALGENAPSETKPDTPSETDGGDGSRKKILLVEDDVALAAVYRSRFELENFELYEVNDGDHALQAAKEFKPDLILLDAMMPKISGFDVLDILRHTPETANIRVVMLTALSQPKDKERAESLGVDDYLVKSQVVIGDVVERVKHHLNMK